jgi:hypothetical protein
MQTREIVRRRHAIRVTRQALEACHEVLVQAAGDKSRVAYAGILADDTSVAFASFDEVLALPNDGDRKLVHLEARVEPSTGGLEVDVEFGGSGYLFLATIVGEEAPAWAAKQQFERVADLVRPRYAFLYHLPVEIAALALGWLIVNYAASHDLGQNLGEAAAIVLHLGIFAWFVGLLVVLRLWLYPRVSFELGEELKREERRKVWRPVGSAGLVAASLVAVFAHPLGRLMGL